MTKWRVNSENNLLGLSEEKESFFLALKEWSFSGQIIVHDTAEEVCELCEKDNIKYQYQITNALGNSLWVGSSCINKFDIAVFDEFGNEIKENKEAFLIKQINKLKYQHVYNTLSNLQMTRPEGDIKGRSKIELDVWCAKEYSKYHKLNARMLNYLVLRFTEEGIVFSPKFFSIKLNSQEGKDKLLSLKPFQYERIKKCLSINQRQFYEDLKYD